MPLQMQYYLVTFSLYLCKNSKKKNKLRNSLVQEIENIQRPNTKINIFKFMKIIQSLCRYCSVMKKIIFKGID